MSIQELLTGGGGLVVLALTVIQIAPIKLNPWSAIAKILGRAINAEVLAELERTRIKLDNHIKTDDERAADMHRARILQFNNELIRNIPHTREEFIEILARSMATKNFARGTRIIPTAGLPTPLPILAGCTTSGYKSTIFCDL